jgi:hypothetical protein
MKIISSPPTIAPTLIPALAAIEMSADGWGVVSLVGVAVTYTVLIGFDETDEADETDETDEIDETDEADEINGPTDKSGETEAVRAPVKVKYVTGCGGAVKLSSVGLWHDTVPFEERPQQLHSSIAASHTTSKTTSCAFKKKAMSAVKIDSDFPQTDSQHRETHPGLGKVLIVHPAV